MDDSKNLKPKLTAEAAYENAYLVAQDLFRRIAGLLRDDPPPNADEYLVAHNLVERLATMLRDMPPPGNNDRPIHWGHVCDISRVNTSLLDVIAFLDQPHK